MSRSPLRFVLLAALVLIIAGAAFVLTRPSATRVPYGIARLPWTIAYLAPKGDLLMAEGAGWPRLEEPLAPEGAAVSPTGAHVACVTQNGALWLVPTIDGPPSRLVDSGVQADFFTEVSPWSADGRALVYAQNGNVCYRRLSGSVRQLTTTQDAFTASMSPDGKLVAYGRKDKAEKDLGLWVVAVKGGEPRQIVAATGDIFSACCPHWSPDGQWIAFLQAFEGGALGVAKVDGSDTRVGIEGAWEPLHWLPDNNTVLFPRVLYGEDADGVWSYSVSAKQAGLLVGSGRHACYALSPDGQKMLLTTTTPEIGKHPAQTTLSLLNLPAATLVGEPQTVAGEAQECRWSPDGQIALLAYDRDNGRLVYGPDLKTLQPGPQTRALAGWVRTRVR